MRHPLSRAVRSAGLDTVDVASRLTVDPKTVERWLGGRLPYPRHRAALAALTGWAERDLWPGIDAREQAAPDTGDILMTYAQRCAVPSETWRKLFASADHEIGILAYSSLSSPRMPASRPSSATRPVPAYAYESRSAASRESRSPSAAPTSESIS